METTTKEIMKKYEKEITNLNQQVKISFIFDVDIMIIKISIKF